MKMANNRSVCHKFAVLIKQDCFNSKALDGSSGLRYQTPDLWTGVKFPSQRFKLLSKIRHLCHVQLEAEVFNPLTFSY